MTNVSDLTSRKQWKEYPLAGNPDKPLSCQEFQIAVPLEKQDQSFLHHQCCQIQEDSPRKSTSFPYQENPDARQRNPPKAYSSMKEQSTLTK